MASKTAICNWALIKNGQPRVSDIDTTDTKPARTLVALWPLVLDATLQAYPWKFAIISAQLAADDDAPANPDWDVQYTVPTDYLALISIKDDPDYEMEGRTDDTLGILTDETAPLYIRYIRRITNTAIFHALFNRVLACDLALEGAKSITDSNIDKDSVLKDKAIAIAQAYAMDAIETPSEELPEDDWITARA